MPSLLHLLEIDLAALALVSGCMVRLLRQGLKQGRAKRALENSLVSAQAPIAVTPFVASRSLIAEDAVAEEVSSEAFALQHAAAASTRRPNWSHVELVVPGDPSVEDEQTPAEYAAEVVTAPVQTAFPTELLLPLLPPNEIYFVGDGAEEAVGAIEDPAAPELPREHVGILFLEDECDLATLKLAEITEIAPRPQTTAVTANSHAEPAPVEFIDGLYADPIDGMPFTPGEEVTPCACGTAYRLETAVWLREEAKGECVLCHRKITGEVRRIVDLSRPDQIAASA